MNKIAANAAAITWFCSEDFKTIPVKPVKPVFCSKPKKPFFILHTANNGVVRKPVFYLEMPEIIRLRCKQVAYEQGNSKYR